MEEKLTIICEHCKKVFSYIRTGKYRRYCSKPCSEAANYARNREERLIYMANWRTENPNWGKEWYQDNKEAVARKRAAEYAADHSSVLERQRRRRVTERAMHVEAIDRGVLWIRDGGLCHICLKPCDPNEEWDLDHVIPLIKGGPTCYDNCAVSHPFCNNAKHHRIMSGDPIRLAAAAAAFKRFHGL